MHNLLHLETTKQNMMTLIMCVTRNFSSSSQLLKLFCF